MHCILVLDELTLCSEEISRTCSSNSSEELHPIIRKCEGALRAAQKTMIGSVDSFDYPYLLLGISLSTAVTVALFSIQRWILGLLPFFLPKLWHCSSRIIRSHNASPSFIAVFKLRGNYRVFTLTSTSFIQEEEHDIWYFLLPLLLLGQLREDISSSGKKRLNSLIGHVIMVLLLHRIAYAFAHLPPRRRWVLFGECYAIA